MVIKTALATAGVLVLSNLPSWGQVRDWLAPLPDIRGSIAADVLTFRDTSINYGPRARVRVLRPEGVYEIDNTPTTEPASEAEPKAEPQAR